MQLIKGKLPKPRRVLLFGPNFSGKSTQASSFPDVIFFDIESSLDDIDCCRTPRLKTIGEVYQAIGMLGKGEFGKFSWVAIDTIDWVEKLIQADVAASNKAESFGDTKFDYGRGRKLCRPYWEKLVKGLDWLIESCEIGLLLLAHSTTIDVTPPDRDKFQRIESALDADARDMLCDWVTELIYIAPQAQTRSVDAGFNRERAISLKGEQRRVIQTTPYTGLRAKNRLNLESEVECIEKDTLKKLIVG